MADSSSNNNRIAKNSIFLSIRLLITLLISLYTTRVLLATLGVEDYGVYNVVCGFVSMFAFLNTSMSNGIQRFFNYELGKNGGNAANKVFNTALVIQSFLALVIVLAVETFGMWYLNNKIVLPDGRETAAFFIFQFSAVSLVLTIIQAPYTAAVMAHEKMDFFAGVGIFDAVLKLVIVVILPYLTGDGLIWYGGLYLGITMANTLLYYSYCRIKFSDTRLSRNVQRNLFKNMLSFSGWNIFGSFANMMKEQGINLVLNLFCGPVVNAARGVAFQVNGAMQGFVSNLSVAIRPQVVQSYAQGDIERTMKLTFSISKLSCCFLYMFALPILLEIDYILRIWLGDNVPEHTSTFVAIVVLTSFVNNLNSAVSNVVHATGIMKVYQLTGSACILLSIPLAYISLYVGAIPEVALAMSFISMTVAQVLALYVLKTLVPYSLKDYINKVIFPIFTVIIMSAIFPYLVHFMMPEGIIRFMLVTLLSVIIVVISIYTIALQDSERQLINNLLSKFVKI